MKISVITASYNSQKTIAFTIESFLCQRHPDKEMLVIDGSSSDETIKIVESFRSAQIGVFQGKDSGVYESMNRGLGLYNGYVVGFMNSDTTFHDQDMLGDFADTIT